MVKYNISLVKKSTISSSKRTTSCATARYWLVDNRQKTVVYQPIYQLQTPIFQLQAYNYQQIYSAHIVTAMGDCCYRGAKQLLQHRGNDVFSLR